MKTRPEKQQQLKNQKPFKFIKSFFNLFSFEGYEIADTPKNLVAFAALFIIIVSFTTVFLSSSELNFIKRSDFKAYYTAAFLIKNGKTSQLYDKDAQHETQHNEIARHNFLFFLNLPASALIFVPLTYLKLETAYKAFSLLSLITSYYAIALLFWFTNTNIKKILYLVFFVPLISSITANQISILIFLIYVFVFIFLMQKKSFWAGVFSGLLILKVQHILFLPFGLILSEDKLKYLKGSVLSLVSYMLLNLLMYGPNLIPDYINFLNSRTPDIKCLEHLGSHNFFSFQAIGIYRCTQTETLILGALSIIFYAFFLFVVYKKRKTQPRELLFSASLIATLFLNYHTRYTDMVYLTIPFLVVLNLVYKSKEKLIPITLMVFFYLMPLFSIERGQWVSVVGFLFVGVYLTVSKLSDLLPPVE